MDLLFPFLQSPCRGFFWVGVGMLSHSLFPPTHPHPPNHSTCPANMLSWFAEAPHANSAEKKGHKICEREGERRADCAWPFQKNLAPSASLPPASQRTAATWQEWKRQMSVSSGCLGSSGWWQMNSRAKRIWGVGWGGVFVPREKGKRAKLIWSGPLVSWSLRWFSAGTGMAR